MGAAGFEPTTLGFGGRYSIQLSYAPVGGEFIARAARERKRARLHARSGRETRIRAGAEVQLLRGSGRTILALRTSDVSPAE